MAFLASDIIEFDFESGKKHFKTCLYFNESHMFILDLSKILSISYKLYLAFKIDLLSAND